MRMYYQHGSNPRPIWHGSKFSRRREKKPRMSRRIELALAACLYYCGLVKLARWGTRRQGSRLVVLCYHRAEGESLRQHLLYLRRHDRILHLEAAVEALYKPQNHASRGTKRRTMLMM